MRDLFLNEWKTNFGLKIEFKSINLKKYHYNYKNDDDDTFLASDWIKLLHEVKFIVLVIRFRDN